jgi:hypothetical protein
MMNDFGYGLEGVDAVVVSMGVEGKEVEYLKMHLISISPRRHGVNVDGHRVIVDAQQHGNAPTMSNVGAAQLDPTQIPTGPSNRHNAEPRDFLNTAPPAQPFQAFEENTGRRETGRKRRGDPGKPDAWILRKAAVG